MATKLLDLPRMKSERRAWSRLPLPIPLFVRSRDSKGKDLLEFATALNVSAGGPLSPCMARCGHRRRFHSKFPALLYPPQRRFARIRVTCGRKSSGWATGRVTTWWASSSSSLSCLRSWLAELRTEGKLLLRCEKIFLRPDGNLSNVW